MKNGIVEQWDSGIMGKIKKLEECSFIQTQYSITPIFQF
jgi:hypothetical protein